MAVEVALWVAALAAIHASVASNLNKARMVHRMFPLEPCTMLVSQHQLRMQVRTYRGAY
jgi:hypothetical protein